VELLVAESDAAETIRTASKRRTEHDIAAATAIFGLQAVVTTHEAGATPAMRTLETTFARSTVVTARKAVSVGAERTVSATRAVPTLEALLVELEVTPPSEFAQPALELMRIELRGQ
jgi:hypothetical protein